MKSFRQWPWVRKPVSSLGQACQVLQAAFCCWVLTFYHQEIIFIHRIISFKHRAFLPKNWLFWAGKLTFWRGVNFIVMWEQKHSYDLRNRSREIRRCSSESSLSRICNSGGLNMSICNAEKWQSATRDELQVRQLTPSELQIRRNNKPWTLNSIPQNSIHPYAFEVKNILHIHKPCKLLVINSDNFSSVNLHPSQGPKYVFDPVHILFDHFYIKTVLWTKSYKICTTPFSLFRHCEPWWFTFLENHSP